MRVILNLGFFDPVSAVSLDEAILRTVGEGVEPPTLRIWRNPRCVVIGRGQRPEEEADLVFCRRHRIPVVRRASGGGAVYHHPGNLNFSLFLPLTGRWRSVRETHLYLGGLVAGELRRLGLPATAEEGGVYVGGQKVSGTAQLRRRGLLYHGTLILWEDRIPQHQVLLALRPGYSPSGVPSRPSPTGSLSTLLGRRMGLEEGVRLLLSAFRPLGTYGRGEPSLREWALALNQQPS
ncbi:MAG TPA: lipoate--protein ligase family protein [Candidatus Acetothermia bacterium]|nr:lipoate--protein ligase family protein [Candidatus Acetothermia bacterium]